jgi:hypothetical protein
MSLPAQIDALVTRLQTMAPARVVTRDYRDFADRDPADLAAGVLTVISLGEPSYPDEIYEPGRFGVHDLMVVGQIQLPEDATGSQVEDAEFAVMADIKLAVQDPLPADLFGLALRSFRQSGQLERPFGWVSASLQIDVAKSRITT